MQDDAGVPHVARCDRQRERAALEGVCNRTLPAAALAAHAHRCPAFVCDVVPQNAGRGAAGASAYFKCLVRRLYLFRRDDNRWWLVVRVEWSHQGYQHTIAISLVQPAAVDIDVSAPRMALGDPLARQGDPFFSRSLLRHFPYLDKITLSIFVTRRRDASSMCLFKSVGVDDVDGLVITIHHDQAPIREPLFEANGDDYTSRAIIEPTIDLASGDVCIGFYQSGYDVFEPLEQKKALEYLENHAPWPKVE